MALKQEFFSTADNVARMARSEKILPAKAQIRLRFRANVGRWPNVDHPTRFSDKVAARILGPSDPIYPIIGHKHLVPAFVRCAVGDRAKVPRRHLVTPKLETWHFRNLPNSFVLKSSYGSGLNAVITDKSELDPQKLVSRFNSRIQKIQNARLEVSDYNCILIEEYLGDESNFTPDDVKIHCFHRSNGKFEYLLQVDTGRHTEYRQSLYDEVGTRLPFIYAGRKRHETDPELPENLDEMISVAKDLSRGFDYLRVDLYSIQGQIYFGELTPFHMGALFRFDDPDADKWIGSKWDQTYPMYSGY